MPDEDPSLKEPQWLRGREAQPVTEGGRGGGTTVCESADWVEGGALEPFRIPIGLRIPASAMWVGSGWEGNGGVEFGFWRGHWWTVSLGRRGRRWGSKRAESGDPGKLRWESEEAKSVGF